MKTIFLILALSFSFAQLSAQEHFIKHNGLNRAYLLYVPKCYNGSSPYPLIIALHGREGNDSALYKNGFNERAEIMGYIAVYPKGINGAWNVGNGGDDDDVDFISELIDTLKANYNIDPKRVYATGHSNGAYLCYTLAVKLPKKISAIAPVQGLLAGFLINDISSPIPIIDIHALDDPAVLYSGTDYAPGVDSLVNIWKNKNRCSNKPDTVYNLNGVIGQLWNAKKTGADFLLYIYSHGGHAWLNFPVGCTDLIVDFFYNHPNRETKVTLTSPVSTSFDAPADIELAANVESTIAVTKVEIFAGSTKINECSKPPYSFNWKSVPQNDYVIYAKAFFANGTSVISSNLKQVHVLSPNIALHKPAECSAIGYSFHPAQSAFDGDFSTRWSTPFSDPQWISVDLQGIYRINGVTLFWETAHGLVYNIDVSEDKKTWTTVYNTTSGNGSNEYISFPPIETRYVRMYGTKRGTPYGYSLWEFQVHGDLIRCIDLVAESLYTHPMKVTLTSPVSTSFDAFTNIELAATVESTIPVAKIEFYADSTKLSECPKPPYSFNWKSVPQNDYLIYAKAVSSDGRSFISPDPKQIHVMRPNLAIHKPSECSAIESSHYSAQNAFDGDFSTRWSTPFSDPQWILVDLQGIYRIDGVTIFWEAACGLAYNIDVSEDKKTWTPVYSTTSGKGGNEYLSFPQIEARYVRMYGTKRSTPYGYSLWEFQVHGEFVKIDVH